MPESENPPEPNTESHKNPSHPAATEATPLTDQEFHEHADRYLNEVVQQIEELQESRQDVDFEHAVRDLQEKYKLHTIGLMPPPGWSSDSHVPAERDLRHQQAAPQQTDLA